MAADPKHTIHEMTRNLTKQYERMLILDALSEPAIGNRQSAML